MGGNEVRILALAAAVACPATARAADQAAPGAASLAPKVTIALKDGGSLVGTVVAEDAASLTLRTRSGAELKVPREAIASTGTPPAADAVAPARSPAGDPNESRLMFAPTGRPLGRGNGYFSDHYVLFPGFAYGLTDNLSVGAGISAVPAVGLSEQVFFVSASSAWTLGDKASLALGGFFAGAGAEDVADFGAAALFGVATFGRPERSLSMGVAAIALREEEYRYDARGQYVSTQRSWRFRDAPVLMLGGSLRLGRNLSLISESWLFLGSDFDLAQQPFGFALRFYGGRLSADVGVVLVKEVLEEGFPVPWLSFSYHFGPARKPASRDGHAATPAWAREATRRER
jgi:hypothetical protein